MMKHPMTVLKGLSVLRAILRLCQDPLNSTQKCAGPFLPAGIGLVEVTSANLRVPIAALCSH